MNIKKGENHKNNGPLNSFDGLEEKFLFENTSLCNIYVKPMKIDSVYLVISKVAPIK